MVDIIYNWVRYSLIGETTLTGADNLALLLTWSIIVLAFLLFVRLAMWAFYLFGNSLKWRKWRK